MHAYARRGLCFGVLPLLPLGVLLMMPDRQPTVWLDPIAVFVYSAIAVGLISAGIAYSGRSRVAVALGYAIATAVLSVLPIVVTIVIVFEINCGGDSSGFC